MHYLRPVFTGILLLAVFARVTAQVRDEHGLIAAGAHLQTLGTGFEFTEGPVADKKGNVYFTDQPNNRIHKWDARTGKISVFAAQAGRANGMYFDKKGHLITCSDESNQLWSFDKRGKAAVLVKDFGGRLLNGPNDVWIAPDGGMYFTDPLYKRSYWKRDPVSQQDGEHVYYLSPDRHSLTKADSLLRKPNGITGTRDGKKIFVADIGAGKTYVYTRSGNGTLTGRTLFVSQGSDGLTLDEKGNLYLTGKGVTIYNKSGEKIGHIPVGTGWTANVCFGGKDRQLLFITSGTAVYGIRMNVKGM